MDFETKSVIKITERSLGAKIYRANPTDQAEFFRGMTQEYFKSSHVWPRQCDLMAFELSHSEKARIKSMLMTLIQEL